MLALLRGTSVAGRWLFGLIPVAGSRLLNFRSVARVSIQELVLLPEVRADQLVSVARGLRLSAAPCYQGSSFRQINHRYIKNVTLLEITFSLVLAILVVISCIKYRNRIQKCKKYIVLYINSLPTAVINFC